ncbi:phosphatidylinositol N-acetylglucosaminyltransferase subunit Q-like [Oscarella lobularis]|uniref:phosphatidylinositol N-acetylglucosaminyltransferase subunit Q-like n=1 Tax=Oscarella lobularis TaxID=121494 RepID=UPI003313C9FE
MKRLFLLIPSTATFSEGDVLIGSIHDFDEATVYLVIGTRVAKPQRDVGALDSRPIGCVSSKPIVGRSEGNLRLDASHSPPLLVEPRSCEQKTVFVFETPSLDRLYLLRDDDDDVRRGDVAFSLALINSRREEFSQPEEFSYRIRFLFLGVIRFLLLLLSFPANLFVNISSSWSGLPGLLSMSKLGLVRLSHKDAINHSNPKSLKAKLQKGNLIFSIGIDVIIGIVILKFLCLGDNDVSSTVANRIVTGAATTIRNLTELLTWFEDAPGGLKLNEDLNRFLKDFFLYLITIWSGYLRDVVRPCLPYVIYFIGLSGMMGFSVVVTLCGDLLSILTLHVYCFYVFAAKIYSLQVYALISLWRLFTGKKWNILRRRVDSFQYDKNQLLLGTLLFTILVFLLPTVAVYYLLFTMIRLAVLVLHSLANWLLYVIVNFPVYSLLLWLVDPKQLPSGIRIELLESSQSQINVYLESQSIGFLGALTYASKRSSEDNPTRQNITEFLTSLLRGYVVYPWTGYLRNKVDKEA